MDLLFLTSPVPSCPLCATRYCNISKIDTLILNAAATEIVDIATKLLKLLLSLRVHGIMDLFQADYAASSIFIDA
jgi:hypothetical protein